MCLKDFLKPIPGETYHSTDKNIHIINDEEFILINLITGELFKDKPIDKTIAQFLGITKFGFEIKNNNGNTIYSEYSNGYWHKCEYDSNNNEIYYENSTVYWIKCEYDSNNKEIYYENSDGAVRDNRLTISMT